MRIVLDPGHGGEHAAGKSTAYGARGPTGALERDVVLRLSQLVAAELGGGATLTRYGNGENLIQSNGFPALRMGTTPWPLSMFSNHFVVLNGLVAVVHERAADPNSTLPVGVQNPRPWGSVTFPIWSFGQNYPDLLSPSAETFASSFFGAIVADLRD